MWIRGTDSSRVVVVMESGDEAGKRSVMQGEEYNAEQASVVLRFEESATGKVVEIAIPKSSWPKLAEELAAGKDSRIFI